MKGGSWCWGTTWKEIPKGLKKKSYHRKYLTQQQKYPSENICRLSQVSAQGKEFTPPHPSSILLKLKAMRKKESKSITITSASVPKNQKSTAKVAVQAWQYSAVATFKLQVGLKSTAFFVNFLGMTAILKDTGNARHLINSFTAGQMCNM